MNTILNLNANNGSQVGSGRRVSRLTGESNTWLFIDYVFAERNQYANGPSDWIFGQTTAQTDAVVNVTLDSISGILLEFATTGSLSGIEEENTWADWYVDSSTLALRENGDLVLRASTTTVSGSPSVESNSLSYCVSATIVLNPASISGTIRWKKSLAGPHDSTHFAITAVTEVPGPSGSPFPTTQVVASGVEGALNASSPPSRAAPHDSGRMWVATSHS